MTLPAIELVWRSMLAENGRFADWVRELSDRSGVYLIRSDPARFADQLLYIGESHTYHAPGSRRSYRGLYRTLTRHFHGRGWSQGLTYSPSDVLVAVILTEPEQAQEYQDVLIAMYKPRDNQLVYQMRLEAWGLSPEEVASHDNGQGNDPPDKARSDDSDDYHGYHDIDSNLPADAIEFPVDEWQ